MEYASREPRCEANGRGTTENVSAGGLCFLTNSWQELRIGLKLQLSLKGFSQYNSGPIFRSLHGDGTVMRLDLPRKEEGAYEKAAVAVRFDERPRVDIYRVPA